MRASLLLSLVTNSRNTEAKLGATVRRVAETRRSPGGPTSRRGLVARCRSSSISEISGKHHASRLKRMDLFTSSMCCWLGWKHQTAMATGKGCGLQPREHGQPATLRVYKPRLMRCSDIPAAGAFPTPQCRAKVGTSAPDDRVVRCQQE